MAVSIDRRSTLSLREKMGCGDGSEVSSRIHCGREDGVVGSPAAGRVAQSDWASGWQAIIVYLLPCRSARRDSPTPTSLTIGIRARCTGANIQRHCGALISTIDGTIAGPLGLDGEPRTWPQWRL